jgi:hypothetical protein
MALLAFLFSAAAIAGGIANAPSDVLRNTHPVQRHVQQTCPYVTLGETNDYSPGVVIQGIDYVGNDTWDLILSPLNSSSTIHEPITRGLQGFSEQGTQIIVNWVPCR